MEVYVVSQVCFFADMDLIERNNFHESLDDLVEIYSDLNGIISSYDFDLPIGKMTEQEIINKLYYDHNIIVVKKEIFTEEVFPEPSYLEITQML